MKRVLAASTPCSIICVDGFSPAVYQTFAKTLLKDDETWGAALEVTKRREVSFQLTTRIKRQIEDKLERYGKRSISKTSSSPVRTSCTLALDSLGSTGKASENTATLLKKKLLHLGQKLLRESLEIISSPSKDQNNSSQAQKISSSPVGLFATIPIIDYWKKGEWHFMPLSFIALLFPDVHNPVSSIQPLVETPFSSVILSLFVGKPLFIESVMKRGMEAKRFSKGTAWELLFEGLDFPQVAEVKVTDGARVSKLSSKRLGGTLELDKLQTVWRGMTALYGGSLFDGSLGAKLSPVIIPKPWGREIWYTGIEARGVSRVKGIFNPTAFKQLSTTRGEVKLNQMNGVYAESSFSSILQTAVLLKPLVPFFKRGVQRAPILLKVLDPFPSADYGDLYYELHQQKREVYAISHIHPEAKFPDLKSTDANPTKQKNLQGAIRIGFNPEKRRAYSSFEAFRADFLKAIQAYRAVRLEIDTRLDKIRSERGIHLTAEVLPEVLGEWMKQIPKSLCQKEKLLRKEMESFSALVPLTVGDAISIIPGVPHSLQHGVRAVEFQTPVYERLIISFVQKTLTQNHWDTEAAFKLLDEARINHAVMRGMSTTSSTLSKHPARGRMIANFADFKVYKYVLDSGVERIEDCLGDYLLLYVLKGAVRLVFKQHVAKKLQPSEVTHILRKEQAFCVFQGARQIKVENNLKQAASIYLKAVPQQ